MVLLRTESMVNYFYFCSLFLRLNSLFFWQKYDVFQTTFGFSLFFLTPHFGWCWWWFFFVTGCLYFSFPHFVFWCFWHNLDQASDHFFFVWVMRISFPSSDSVCCFWCGLVFFVHYLFITHQFKGMDLLQFRQDELSAHVWHLHF